MCICLASQLFIYDKVSYIITGLRVAMYSVVTRGSFQSSTVGLKITAKVEGVFVSCVLIKRCTCNFCNI